MTQLRKVREQAGMTRKELATISGIDYMTLYKIETGVLRPFPGWRRRIAAALGVDEKVLFEESPVEPGGVSS